MHYTPHHAAASSQLIDRFGRTHRVLRLSVTDRCNLRCGYCMPGEDHTFTPHDEQLGVSDMVWFTRLLADHGVTRVRLTGGEPLLRKELCALIEQLAAIPGIEDISLTTNGMLLERKAADLASAGLNRVNISLDSLDSARLRHMTRHGDLARILRGVQAASDAGLGPIKVNALLLKGVNDDELPAWIELLETQALTVRFMELMPIGQQDTETIDRVVDLTAMREELTRTIGLAPAPDAHQGNGPAVYWRAPGWRGTLGLITPMSRPYCNTCARLRLSCAGVLMACLASELTVNLRAAITRRDTRAVLGALLLALDTKPRGHHWQEGARTAHGMSTIGG